jgi:hypothetical protein
MTKLKPIARPVTLSLYESPIVVTIESHLRGLFKIQDLEPHTEESAKSIRYRFLLDSGLSLIAQIYTVGDNPRTFLLLEIAMGMIQPASKLLTLERALEKVGSYYLPARLSTSTWSDGRRLLCLQFRCAGDWLPPGDGTSEILSGLIYCAGELKTELGSDLESLPIDNDACA